jgi:HSP20 family protein
MLPLIRRTTENWPSLADEIFSGDIFPRIFGWDGGRSVPAVNITENKSNYKIDVAAPGLDKNDFKVNLDGNLLTVSSEKEVKNETKEEDYLRREFSYSSFSRCFNLPETADANNIKASHKDGVLSLVIPKKKESAKTVKEIKVS